MYLSVGESEGLGLRYALDVPLHGRVGGCRVKVGPKCIYPWVSRKV